MNHFYKSVLTILVTAVFFSALAFWFTATKEPEPLKTSGAYEALKLWGAQRAYPHANIPDRSHYAAFEKISQTLSKPSGPVTVVTPWETMGPHNIGGRTLAVAFNPQNPNTIFAGAASGGLWRSTTGGIGAAAWERLEIDFPVLAVSTIAIAPNDSNTIYIGTGEVYSYQSAGTGAAYRHTRGTYGIGILKTTDGGATWVKSLDWRYNQSRGVWAVKFDPNNSNVLWAATSDGTYRSTDAGESWNKVHNVIMANDVVIDPNNSNNIVVGCGNFSSPGNGLYRSTNGGNSWAQITQGVPSAFAGKIQLDVFKTPFNTLMLASFGNGFNPGVNNASWLCKSLDGGATWDIVSQTDYSQWQGWFSHDAAFNPANFNEIIAVGIQVYRSTNGGSTLNATSTGGTGFGGVIQPGDPEGSSTYVHSDVHDVQFHPTDPTIVYFATDGGVFRSEDGGITFRGCNGGYQTAQFYNGFSSSAVDSNFAMGGLQDNSTTLYLGNTAWWRGAIGGDGAWTAMHHDERNTIYGSSQFLNVLKSTNGGSTWQNLGVPGGGRIASFIAPFVIGRDNPEIIYAARDIVYKSSDGGGSWFATNSGQALDGNPVLAMAIAPQNSSVVYAATAPFSTRPGVFRSINGGAAWANITATLPNRYPTDLTVHPLEPAAAYITFSGFGTSHLFMTSDFGGSWTDIGQGLPDVPANAVIIDPLFPEHVYVGTDLGVFFSPDGGSTWDVFSDGLPPGVIAMSLAISPQNRKLRVATHGNGAYQRDLVSPVTGLPGRSTLPDGFRMAQNYPNPFNPETTIHYTLGKTATISLKIYNALGQEVQTLVSARIKTAGEYRVLWDGRDQYGNAAASGVYVYRLFVDDAVQARRMVLTR